MARASLPRGVAAACAALVVRRLAFATATTAPAATTTPPLLARRRAGFTGRSRRLGAVAVTLVARVVARSFGAIRVGAAIGGRIGLPRRRRLVDTGDIAAAPPTTTPRLLLLAATVAGRRRRVRLRAVGRIGLLRIGVQPERIRA